MCSGQFCPLTVPSMIFPPIIVTRYINLWTFCVGLAIASWTLWNGRKEANDRHRVTLIRSQLHCRDNGGILLKMRLSARQLVQKFDVVVVGGGHNGLTAAAYLGKSGKRVLVVEKRHVLGGAAVTEEIIPGFKFSRASYLLSLLRPAVIEELKLKEFGLKYFIRNPYSFTPIRDSDQSLLLGSNMQENQKEIARFSEKDAKMFPIYEKSLEKLVVPLQKLMDQHALDIHAKSKWDLIKQSAQLFQTLKPIGLKNAMDFYELMTAPISKVMNKWFESDVLKATLGTDAVIGSPLGPFDAGAGYVLLHHVLGGLDGVGGSWGYVVGGMGAVSEAIANSAQSHGVQMRTDCPVKKIIVDDGAVKGVALEDGSEIHADIVLSNATPEVTFRRLLDETQLPAEFLHEIKHIDYTSPVTKINVAVKELPQFACRPSTGQAPWHQTTIHMNSESMELVNQGVMDYRRGEWSRKPLIEMTIPSSVDRSIVPDDPNAHVVLLFTQYTPYNLPWDSQLKETYAKHVFSEIDAYAPNFSKSIIGYEVLTPPDLESTFGLTGGNIFHGAISLDQLYFARPTAGCVGPQTPIRNLFLCGSGAHPGGGVTGAPGRLAALSALKK